MRTEINISKIPVGGGIAGLMIALVVMIIAFIGIPATRLFFAGSVAIGAIIAVVLRMTDRAR